MVISFGILSRTAESCDGERNGSTSERQGQDTFKAVLRNWRCLSNLRLVWLVAATGWRTALSTHMLELVL